MRKREELVLAASDEIIHDHHHDGIDRRGLLKCMTWAGAGAFCVMKGGLLHSYAPGGAGGHTEKGELSFVPISDSHMGFSKPTNSDVAATLKAAIDKINALPRLRSSCCVPEISAIYLSLRSSTTLTKC
jgi:Icc protein